MINVGKERKCYVCGRHFIISNEWAYRRTYGTRERVFCSWGCMRKFDKARGTKPERRDRIVQALKDGLSVKEICALLSEDVSVVAYWAKKMEAKGEIRKQED